MRVRTLVVLVLFMPLLAAGNCVDDFNASFKASKDAKRSDLVAALLCIEQSRSVPSALPIGTVIASMLAPADFAKEVGDPISFDDKNSRWTLADGRDIGASKYKTSALSSKVPDLRGMFLRGLNVGRSDGLQDPDSHRLTGSVQTDELKAHTHELGFGRHGLASGKGNGNLETGFPQVSTGATGDVETRPRNIAVHYYIKIN